MTNAMSKPASKASPAKKAAPKPAEKKAATTKPSEKKSTAPKKAPAKKAAPKPAARTDGREMVLARVEAVRLAQRQEGHFDCFGRAVNGFCDQGDCAYHAECLSVSQLVHSL